MVPDQDDVPSIRMDLLLGTSHWVPDRAKTITGGSVPTVMVVVLTRLASTVFVPLTSDTLAVTV